MANIHSEKFLISTTSAGVDTKIRFSALLGHMQDAASRHAFMLGVGYEQLERLHRTFVLSRIELHILGKLPTWGQKIHLQTWPRKLDRLLTYRDFSLCVEGQSVHFLKATSAWVLIDTQNRRPARPHDALFSIQMHPQILIGDDAPERIRAQKDSKTAAVRLAYHSDLDPNGHVNNTRYFDWITDTLVSYLGSPHQIRMLSINFQREIQLGDEVQISVKSLAADTHFINGKSGTSQHFSALVKVESN